MLVYGDHHDRARPEAWLNRIEEALDAAARLPGGIGRHASIVSALIESGRLLQGVADADFAQAGLDRLTPAVAALSEYIMQVARAVVRSWDSGFTDDAPLLLAPRLVNLPEQIELRVPEGYAFYALYPEAYVAAARKLRLSAPPRVIAIRSIAASLGPMVAAVLEAPAPVTVRPFGDPFAREIAVSAELEQHLLAGDAHFVIVDEGPGQSGSSFGAVADWLQQRGVPLERIAFLPSHGGHLGPHASAAHRQRWAAAQRVPAEFGAELPQRLAGWLTSALGWLDRPLVELSGGEWRRHFFASDQAWPPAHTASERRKFLAQAGGERFLVKFAGFGIIGRRKLTMARALHTAGLAPEPVDLVHGFLVERWCEGARPIPPEEKPMGDVARYIGARARLFPAEPHEGASLEQLLAMARRNVSLGLGAPAAAALDIWAGTLGSLAKRVVRVGTDNKLERHEWLRTKYGHLLKTDGLDHHCAHDLIGCQDVAWDVAAALFEFRVNGDLAEEFIGAVESAAGRHVDRKLLEFYRVAYLAFRLGQATMAAEATSTDTAERARLERQISAHAAELQQLLLERTGGESAEFLGRLKPGTNRLGNKAAAESVDEEDAAKSLIQ
jgi:hypothetical protein